MMQVLANFSCVRPCSPPVRYPLRLEIARAEIERGPDAGETAAACDDCDDPVMGLSLRANGCVMRPRATASDREIAVVILATVTTCLCSPT
jgi:hypothetical protein